MPSSAAVMALSRLLLFPDPSSRVETSELALLIHVRIGIVSMSSTLANLCTAKQSEAREITDWSRKGPLPDLPGRGGNDRGADRGYNSGGRFEGAEGGRERREFNQDDGRVRDFGNWERKGPLAAPVREGGRTSTQGPRGDSFNDRRASPAAWGEGRPQGSQDGGSRPPRREFQERPVHERAPTAAEQDSKWRQKMRPDAPIASPSEEASQAAPAGRPKLNLAKRTTSAAVDAPATSVDSPATSGDAKASPFGAARPIDTAAKEREIEDKRLAALEAKKKVDEKAKEDEKEAKEAEAAAAAVAEVAQKVDGLEIVDKDAAAAKPVEATRPSESAWRKPAAAVPKPTQTDARDAPRPRRDGPARGPRNDNRAPRENRGPRVNGGPQNDASAAVAAPQAASTPAVEAEPSPATEDGWSTVQKPKKISRGSYRN